ncbi:hypothetical protein K438DRAFT_1768827 [Mycena galopus ATCC 62051]|nr:hypothetical protein K438DRAFT_1768827 [Mycena galopus ATCC 62051]
MSLTNQFGRYRHLVPPHIMHNQAHSLTFPSFQLNFGPGSENSLVALKGGQDLKSLSSAKDRRPKYKTLRPKTAPVAVFDHMSIFNQGILTFDTSHEHLVEGGHKNHPSRAKIIRTLDVFRVYIGNRSPNELGLLKNVSRAKSGEASGKDPGRLRLLVFSMAVSSAQFSHGGENSLVAPKVKPKGIDHINGNSSWICKAVWTGLEILDFSERSKTQVRDPST